ncbi:MAG: diacylglycerol O-acyltransferase [Curvibacter sp. RIFCSPHIGHO2_12_FULL_63_18]|uniref:wax ester/triacylglycerol synthase family O-acyltransferase n=1 Tax=Rhodoferax sp. TaxID=50421 RepID=UPI0008D672BD|nr:MAG: diacylglycerol O-acyltransferase [Curvibacter sp. GWA2_63_95]OGO99258.1 MAG: diacylglycerol O-acyltransferase [Curvibacter sp. RIFCSPHIGHO2_12_FULL_63_18]HCX81187.1 wax ester/triacylglycerol synthase family O-acyltransferase [Rhodoferax sp.]
MVTRVLAQDVAQKAKRRVAATVAPVGPVAKKATRQAQKAARVVQKNVTDAVVGSLGLHGERMSKVDTAWLRMDSAANLMMIVGVWVIHPKLKLADLQLRIEERLLKYPRFVQCAVEDAAGATWVKDPAFNIGNHLVTETLAKKPAGREQEALQDRLAQLTMEPLDKRHPLWQIHLVEDYKGGSAMMVRIHHCIADGIALISVTQSLVDGGAPPPQRTPREARADGLEGAEEWIANALLKPFTSMTVKALGAAGEGAARSMGLLMEPQKGMEQGMHNSVDAAKMAYQVVSDLASLALMPDDSPTRLKGLPGNRKRVAWCPPIPLEEVKAVGKALNCSINDVLLSCVAGAIGEYLKEQGEVVTGKEIRAMVPVNLRPMEQAYKLGNQFGLAPLVLPIGVDNPVERVYEVRTRMRGLKGSMQPLLAFGLLAVAGLLIKPAQDALLNLFSKKTTAVMTNVPGPREKLKICGSTIEETLFWVPQSGSVGLGVSILSYGGGVQFGVVSDAKLCPDPQKIIDQFEPEFAKLSMLTLMLPWGD